MTSNALSVSPSHSTDTVPKPKPILPAASPSGALANVKYEHLVAGISGGIASTLALHPLDLLKVRLAVNDGLVVTRPQYTGLTNAITTIFRQEGLRGFYRGVTPNCWGAGASWGFYFLFYNTIKSHMSNGTSPSAFLSPGQHILAACEAGALTLALTNPIWVVKTRLCLQYGDFNELAIDPTKRYNGMVDALKKVYHFEGVRGLYRGFVPGIFGVSHGALQFMAYEELKKYYIKRYNMSKDDKLSTGAYLSCAALSKLFAAVITYPYQVVRARLQDQYANYHGMTDVIRRTWRYERFGGFYKGLAAYLLHVTPNICIVFLIYERLSPPTTAAVVSKPLAPSAAVATRSAFVDDEHGEGVPGFYKGIVPNLIRVTPACAITFVVYENVSYYMLNWAKQPKQQLRATN